MVSRTRSNPLALAVLTLLHERPMHPYEMSSTLRERRKEDSIKLNYGSLYSVVDSLVKRGLIAPHETVRDGKRPERTVYVITESGTAEMTEWLGDLLGRPAKEFTQFEAALSLMAIFGPDEVLRLLDIRLGTLRAQETAYYAMLAGMPGNFPRIFLIESEFRAKLLRTEIEFVDDLAKELREGTFHGMDLWLRMQRLRESGASPAELEQELTKEFKEELEWINKLSKETPPQ